MSDTAICTSNSGLRPNAVKSVLVEKFTKAIFKFLTLSLPECLRGFCKVTLTFESADEILSCDHSNESSLPVLSHGAICLSKC